MKTKKKKVGIFSLTCDEGCSIYLVEIFNKKLVGWLEKIEIAYFLSIKDKVEIKDFDIVLIEGTISTERDREDVLKLRANSKILIAMGTCAMTALPSGQRNNFNEQQLANIKEKLNEFQFLPKCLALKDVVKVDAEVPGCPINPDALITTFEKFIYM